MTLAFKQAVTVSRRKEVCGEKQFSVNSCPC